MEPMKRYGSINRKTKETQIALSIDLDGSGKSKVSTTIGFLDHMFELFAKHGHFDLTVKAKGDTHIDQHHLVEDLGIALGEAIAKAVGDKKGISRYGNFLLPMDETLSYVALDLSNRPYFIWKVKLQQGIRIGGLEGDLLEHFFESIAMNARMNLHMALKHGKLPHHISESLFKGFARALSAAVKRDARIKGVLSTKGKL